MSTDWYGTEPRRGTRGYDRAADFGDDDGSDGYGRNGHPASNGSADWARQSRASHRAPDPYDPRDAGRAHDPYQPNDPYAPQDPYATTDPYSGRDSYRGQDPYADPYSDRDPYQGRDDYGRQDDYPAYGDDGGAGQWQQRQDGYQDPDPYRWQPPERQDDPYGGDDYADGRYQADPYGQDENYRPDPYSGDPYAGQDGYRDDGYSGGRYADEADDYQGGGRDYRGGGRQAGGYAAAAEQGEPDEWDERQQRSRGFFTGFGDEPEAPVRARKRRRSKAPYIILPILLIILGAAGYGGYYVYHRYEAKFANYPAGTAYGSVKVTVPQGGSAASIAQSLLADGVIAGTRQFVTVATASGKASSLQPGVYKLQKHMSDAAAWALLLSPKARVNADVTIPDGLRATKIIALLAQKTGKPLSQFQAALKDTAALGLPSYAHGNPEGYLWPDTYDFGPGSSALSMLQTMVKQFNTEAGKLHLVAGAKIAQLTPAQVITEASLLEAEVNQSTYYPKVARVIDNRLNDLMPLQLDSTIAYITNDYNYNFTYAQLHTPSPYNTFLHQGLPPGPIDSPGAATIEAVLHPSPRTDTWTFFVTINKAGLTKFTSSQTQFDIWSHEAKQNGV
jgi:uncharacterized YceG family protein